MNKRPPPSMRFAGALLVLAEYLAELHVLAGIRPLSQASTRRSVPDLR